MLPTRWKFLRRVWSEAFTSAAITSASPAVCAKMKTRNPINGQRNFRGRFLGIDGDEVLFEDRTSGR